MRCFNNVSPRRRTLFLGALTIPAAAKYLSCSVKFIRTLIWSRQIKYAKVGRRFVIAREELDRWLLENQQHA